MRKKSKEIVNLLKNVIWILLISVIVLFCGLCILIVLYFFYYQRNKQIEQNISNESRNFLKIPSNKESSLGSVSYFNEIDKNEIESYINDQIISNFGSTEYQCTGFCYCDNHVKNEYLSSSSSIFTRPLVYFLTASTSLVAYNIARNQFIQDCEEEIQDDCEITSIKSEVDECLEIVPKETTNEIATTKSKKKKDRIKQVWTCQGNCVMQEYLEDWVNQQEIIHDQITMFDWMWEDDKAYDYKEFEKMLHFLFRKRSMCEKLQITGEITTKVSQSFSKLDNKQPIKLAKKIFEREHMVSFCLENGIFDRNDNLFFGEKFRELKKWSKYDKEGLFELKGKRMFWCSTQQVVTEYDNINCEKVSEIQE